MLKLIRLRSLIRVCDNNAFRTTPSNIRRFFSQIDSLKYSRTNDDFNDINNISPPPIERKMHEQVKNALVSKLGCTTEESLVIMSSNKIIEESTMETITEKIARLHELGLSSETIVKYPWLLALTTSRYSKNNAPMIKTVKFPINYIPQDPSKLD